MADPPPKAATAGAEAATAGVTAKSADIIKYWTNKDGVITFFKVEDKTSGRTETEDFMQLWADEWGQLVSVGMAYGVIPFLEEGDGENTYESAMKGLDFEVWDVEALQFEDGKVADMQCMTVKEKDGVKAAPPDVSAEHLEKMKEVIPAGYNLWATAGDLGAGDRTLYFFNEDDSQKRIYTDDTPTGSPGIVFRTRTTAELFDWMQEQVGEVQIEEWGRFDEIRLIKGAASVGDDEDDADGSGSGVDEGLAKKMKDMTVDQEAKMKVMEKREYALWKLAAVALDPDEGVDDMNPVGGLISVHGKDYVKKYFAEEYAQYIEDMGIETDEDDEDDTNGSGSGGKE